MPWLGQPCALHAPPAAAARFSLAWRAAPGGRSVSTSPAKAPSPCAGLWLLSGQVQPSLAARRGRHQPAGLRASLATASIRLPEPCCGQNRLLLLLLGQPEREAAGRAHQLLSKITLRATTAGGGGGDSSRVRAQKDVGGSPENEPADHSENEKKPNKSQQLKKVFKEYGAVGVVFHVGISLMSLGMFYLAVSSGVDIAAILFKLGFDEALVQSKLAAGTSAFVLAYAIHKLFAPVRISITLVSVPLLVRYFRKIGFFKPPAPNP